ncbi:hypothetical protein [Zavarzinella formosa]|uniref:hypothetical protein n=1 Tax=Zavarzinella formosa TaxID=360055 RepID=UPI000309573B|nr:hypothetical protein [Zavarzinella formosa]
MRRLALLSLAVLAATLHAEQFDYHTFPVLNKAVMDGSVKEAKELTSDQLGELTGVLPDTSSAMLIVVTNDKHFARLLVQPARQKLGMDKFATILLIDKYVTYRGTTERAVLVQGANTQVYPGLRMSLDIGQVVPEAIGGDLTVVANEKDPNQFTLKPIKDAKIYVLAKPIAGVVPKKAPKLVVGEVFETRFFNGKYKLSDDGRRTGELRLEVTDTGEIGGVFVSDRDGREYEVSGKAGMPKHQITFTIKFPATTQSFSGYMFTGNGKGIAGTTKIGEREAGFYADRVED